MKFSFEKNATIILIIVLLVFAGLIYYMKISYVNDSGSDTNNSNSSDGRTYCGQREEICPEIYSPVCGWFNESIKCIKYPCAATYSNSCFSCADSKVDYWTQGECPSG